MKRLDIVIIIFIVVIAVASLGVLKMSSNKEYGEKYAEVYVDTELIKSIAFDDTSSIDPFTINTEDGFNTIKIQNGLIEIIDADCPDELCVKDGPISNPGEILVCLPHKVVIEIKGYSKSEVDEMSY